MEKLLKWIDVVICWNEFEKGKIKAFGNFEELLEKSKSFKEMTIEGMRQTFEINTFAPALIIKEFSTLLKKVMMLNPKKL